MKQFDAEKLLNKYREGACTLQEKAIIESYIESEGITPRDLLSIESELILNKEEVKRIAIIPKKLIYWPLRITAIAASIIFAWGIWTLIFFPEPKVQSSYTNDIDPGGNKAILTLANGKQINLSDARAGALASQQGLEIIKDADGQISYKITGTGGNSGKNEYNTIATPRGGQYTVTLPDGSKIWLNATSTLKYPTQFAPNKREVSLSGEAYFEISKDKSRPFIVSSATQEVEVLGTHFNVSSYDDEVTVKTTLLEGSVRVSLPNVTSLRGGTTKQSQQQYVVLKPNEESSLTKNNIHIKQVDPDEAVAWKNGKFLFRNQPLEQIMNKLSRWYDVEVIYNDKALAGQLFGGIIARSEKISRVLQTLEETGEVHFKIEGRKVTVMK